MNNKRGLSTIIMTLIIILISLVAVGIFWVVVNNLIKGGTEEVSFGRLTLSAEIKGVDIENSSNNVSLLIKRNVGEGDITGMKFIFYSDDKNEIVEQEIQLEELEQESFTFHLTMNVSLLTKISIAPIFSSSDGKESVGNIADTFDVKTGTRIVIPPSGCTPTTNPCGSRICGNIANGTCGSISCGTCSVGTCNSTGQCATSCVPTTCEALGHNCGSGYANGTCAGTLDCGTCSGGQTCVGGTCSGGAGYTCGNNIVEPGEACDGTNLSGYTCATVAAGFASGSLSCNSNCRSYVTTSCVAGNTINAASCSQTDVQAAINSASDGDIVQVPAGSCTWTSPGDYQARITITKSILLRGNGQDSTIINSDNARLFSITGNGKSFRMTGIGFTGTIGSTGVALIWINGFFSSLRVDHCNFFNLNGRDFMVGYYTPGTTNPAITGLFDHINFTNTQAAVPFMMYYGRSDSWLYPDDLGTNNALFIEDSSFRWDVVDGSNDMVSDAEHGAKVVFRYNNITHGFIGWHDTGSTPQSRGTRLFQLYNNNFFCPAGVSDCGWRAMLLRGGTGVIYNNVIPIYPTGYEFPSATQIFRSTQLGGRPWRNYCDGTTERVCSDFMSHCNGGDYRSCEGDYMCAGVGDGTCSIDQCTQDSQCGSGNTCLAKFDGQLDSFGWPCRDQIGRGQDDSITHVQASSPVYWWNNKKQSDNSQLALYVAVRGATPEDTDYIKPNRDYYTYTSGFTGATGMGMGLRSARPATCTTGVGYFATDENTLYTCTSTNTWNLHYAPFPYPHPISLIN
ncbi:MAG: hypothetical protein PHQ66_01995 [Candidatus Nanoarchaeia archaeon]|nr:hypothetical protein [Candidatus Nanoarchaeia archaeon]MDD5357856.1 hypothetical protein [Candidatus Nanoarchaeia archaeon]MDD5588775.1 hypothetical protein [Candidatus Nanoarchaeia archaeon]